MLWALASTQKSAAVGSRYGFALGGPILRGGLSNYEQPPPKTNHSSRVIAVLIHARNLQASSDPIQLRQAVPMGTRWLLRRTTSHSFINDN